MDKTAKHPLKLKYILVEQKWILFFKLGYLEDTTHLSHEDSVFVSCLRNIRLRNN